MPGSVARPSTANTMCLVLKPRQQTEEYTHNAPFMGSESEREAWRKNRVIQMKLGAYLAEVQVQQQSCARLLKTEEYRFMQEATRRSSVPRSVEMLQQLHCYRQKHFPCVRYAYGSTLADDAHHHHHHHQAHPHSHHKHPPLSARPLRCHRQLNGFNRPKTSATIYRKSLEADQDDGDLPEGHLDFEKPYSYDKNNNRVQEQIFELIDRIRPAKSQQQQQQQQPTRQTAELPAINLKENLENVLQQEVFIGRSSTPRKPSQSIDTGRKALFDTKAVALPRTPLAPKQNKTDSMSTTISKSSSSTYRQNSNSKINLPDNLSQQQGKSWDADRDAAESILGDTRFVTDENDQVFENNPIAEVTASPTADDEENAAITSRNALADENDLVNEVRLEFPDDDSAIDFVADDDQDAEIMGPAEKQFKRPSLKSVPRKTSFNRIRTTDPIVPLRHNITSVLRQERARYEANQLKVKNYIHKMSSRDTISRSLSREHSAQSRKNSARLNDSRKEAKVVKKV